MAPVLTLLLKGDILRPLHWALLPKIGVNRSFPKAIVPVAAAVRGLGLKSLELEQGLERLAHISILWTLSTISKFLLKISLELLQLKVGSSSFVLHLPFERFTILATDCWFISVWEFCSAYKIFPHFPDFILPSPTALNDKSIIDTTL